MSIKAPSWCENAVPTANGWEDPNTGELYASKRFTQKEIAEFYGTPSPQVLTEVPEPSPSMLTEAPVGGKSLEEMTKVQLEALGRTHGIELDRRKTKADLIEEVTKVL